MKKYFLILLPVIFSCVFASAQITKIEHFFVGSPQAEKLFQLFKDDFQLPVAWKFQSWGDFASGGVTLGNVAFEFVSYKEVSETKFEGIALEPEQSLDVFISKLDQVNIQHDTIQNNTYLSKEGVLIGWSTIGLENLLPKDANLFICDYKEREMVAANRKKAADSLEKRNGGLLGVIALKEIVVHTTNYQQHNKNLSKLPGVNEKGGGLFSFSDGPAIRLMESDKNGTHKIILNVRSLAAAKSFLQSKKMLGETGINSIFILPEAIDGLKVELVE